MYIYILLAILLALETECRSGWNIIEDLLNPTVTFVPEDGELNIKELVNKYGYILDEHTVITEDGYIINFHRICREYVKNNSQVVFLMHGSLESSDSWLLQGPDNGFAYVLADKGFNVWMGNARGNRNSFKHKTLKNTSAAYWKFTWEQLGIYDLPAMIDYVLEKTKTRSIYYVGYSQGTTAGYVLLSMKPEYNKKIKILFSLAPEAWMGHVKSPFIRFFSPAFNLYGSFLIDINFYTPITDYYNKISWFLCSTHLKCNILYAITGYSNTINETLLPVIFGHIPTGSSVLQFVHYGQLVNSKRFCRYNYGYEGNIEIYGVAEPPDYDLSNIVVPNVLFYSDSDWLSDVEDVDILKNHLSNVLAYIFTSNFTHMDYLYSTAARDAIYIKIVGIIRKFEESHDLDVNIVPK